MHQKKITHSGADLGSAAKALIMVHGRGGSAEDILSLAAYLQVQDFSLLAPTATGNSWYPYSFLAPPAQNEPWLSSALNVLRDTVGEITAAGIRNEDIYLLGFSQGACLILEFAARQAGVFGGVVAFTGGLIGDKIYTDNYTGDFQNTPVLIATSDPDPHVPVERVHATFNIFREMNANVHEQVYPRMGHTITADEIALANKLIFAPTAQ